MYIYTRIYKINEYLNSLIYIYIYTEGRTKIRLLQYYEDNRIFDIRKTIARLIITNNSDLN